MKMWHKPVMTEHGEDWVPPFLWVNGGTAVPLSGIVTAAVSAMNKVDFSRNVYDPELAYRRAGGTFRRVY